MASPASGNAVVGQAGGPTVVINQSLVGVIEEAQKFPHIKNLLGARHGVRGIINEQFFDLNRQPKSMLELVARTPAAALGATRDKPDKEYCERIFNVFRKNDVRYFFYIGGNDSAETANIVSTMAQDAKYELRVIHVPKTIDNDLLVTDHCPGYGSAAKFVASAFIGDNLDNRALKGVKINIIMGRNAGFLTAASILARQRPDDGPHLVYLPERPFDIDQFVKDVQEVFDRYGRCLVAVSEGIADKDGKLWAEKVSVLRQENLARDAFGNLQLSAGAGSLADYLAGTLRNRSKNITRVRSDTFGYLQRSFPGYESEVDAWEARLVGQMAVSYSLDDTPAGSVALVRLPSTTYTVGTKLIGLREVAPEKPPKTKEMPAEYINEAGNNVLNSFREYVGPLVGDLPKVGWLEQVAP
ncbi:MAG TPA: 6-phosphofructokinase [Phycisphaerae bacterium]|jgi:6-phosphofructokinase 1|nr:6-phosphofructokinase [Phycisphaerae bacterium]HOB76535.1 6-phosphofructokinase [Phycisphaerae bacterium]HOJ56570.1 6-phosphofructokinase [Phycisphaerae bacterium]HOL28360.1 6-phosphofructokinase [Phycisphaerae bacterium]HPP19946.1 6-phosphofructokinase [Phycisphaerae bacterium]